ncbi:tetratricopeptide repeat protein [Spirochaeta cellobiosiphila]|uniref:tetratricopeptide repeat protein n=1 Tax=Spirochaeta cellobiosiphila TaxID=504483 RepID=UPI0012EBCF0D|nr:hypothetical protein [Spirochaeta cellobiosiphila]
MKKIVLKILIITIILNSCSNENVIKQKLQDEYSQSSKQEYFNYLLKMKEKNPNSFYINTDLGLRYLLDSKLAEAEESLSAAEKELIDSDSVWTYKLYAGLSSLEYRKNNYTNTIDFGRKALDNDKNDSAGVNIIIARSLVKFNKNAEAFERMKHVYNNNVNLMKYDDWNFLSELAINQEETNYAYKLWLDYWKRNGYQPSLGLKLSLISGLNGNATQSLLYSYIDMDYQLSLQYIDEQSMEAYISKLKTIEGSPDEVVDLLTFYKNKKYNEVISIIKKVPDNLVTDFIELISLNQINQFNLSDYNKFINLIPYYYNHPIFWKNLIDMGTSLNQDIPLRFYELGILYSETNTANKYRESIAKNNGVSEEFATYMLVPQEVQSILSNYIGNQNVEILRPLVHFLNLPKVYSTQEAIEKLKLLQKSDIKVKKYLELVKDESTGILKTRLEEILAAN